MTTRRTACRWCRAPRVSGIRTCGQSCARGIDPRLAELLGVLPWAVHGTRPSPEELRPPTPRAWTSCCEDPQCIWNGGDGHI